METVVTENKKMLVFTEYELCIMQEKKLSVFLSLFKEDGKEHYYISRKKKGSQDELIATAEHIVIHAHWVFPPNDMDDEDWNWKENTLTYMLEGE